MFLFVLNVQGVWAQSGEWKDYAATGYASGNGSKDNPYVINSAAQLAYMAKEVSNTQNVSVGKYYVLGDNIDLSAHYWNSIGDGKGNNGENLDYRFKGNFDGRGYTIKNMRLQWTAGNTWTATGLFGIVLGKDDNNWACVKNLIIDNAKVERKSGNITDTYYMIGILAGEVRQNSEISNIIVKNSVMSDGGSAFEVKNKGGIRFGGILGNTNDKNAKYRIFNLVAENVTMDFSNTTYNSSSTYSYMGAIISRFEQSKGTDAKYIFAKNIFSDVTVKFNQSQVKQGKVRRGNVFAIDAGAKDPDNWYYTTPLTVNSDNSVNYGQQKALASYGSTFVNQANDFLSEKEMSDMLCWDYSQSSGFVFVGTLGTLSSTHESTHLTNAHVYTLNTTGNYTYEWYVGGVKQSSTTNVATLPTKAVEQEGRVVVKNGSRKLFEKNFVIPAEIYGVEDHLYANSYAGGNGTQESPYIISNDLQLAKLALDVNKGRNTDKYYRITADIDLSKAIWTPIGSYVYDTNKTFKGSLDGVGHTIKDMQFDWYSTISDICCYGLFTSIEGTSGKWSDVRNLIIDNANIKCDNASKLTKTRRVGTLVGVIHHYSNIQNIIVRNSQITGPTSPFAQNGQHLVVGGFAAMINDNDNNYNLNNIAVDAKINIDQLVVSDVARVYIGGFIAECQKNVKTCVNNVYSQSTIKVPSSCENVGSVFGTKYDNVSQTTLYYVNGARLNQGTQKSLNGFAVPFCNANNDYIVEKDLKNMKSWSYDSSIAGFRFLDFSVEGLTSAHKASHVTPEHTYTLTLNGVNASNYKFSWKVGPFTSEGVSSGNTNVVDLPTLREEQSGSVKILDKASGMVLFEKSFVIPAEIYGVEDHICAPSYGGGKGTQASPYLISNDSQLAKLAFDINNGWNLDKHFKITADIDLSKAIWTPIGSTAYDVNTTFKGTLDGNGRIISNMLFDWYSTKNAEGFFGLFSTIGGGTVRNLIIDNARGTCSNNSNIVNSRLVGILAGAVREKSNIQNVIIRKSRIAGASTAFSQNGKWVIVGGAIGKLVEKTNNYTLNNIAADVEIDLSRLTVNQAGNVHVGGVIAECETAIKSGVNNLYAQGTIDVNASCDNVGSVFGIYFNNIPTNTLYYVNGAKLNQGTQKSLNEFAVPFCDANNEFIESSGDDALSSWNYNESNRVFFFSLYGTELTVDYRNAVLVTAKTSGMSGSENYNWYISEDKVTWTKSNLSNTNRLSLPYEGNVRYIYAEVADESSRSKSMKISTIIKADAFMTKTNGTYTVNLTNSLWDDDTQYLAVNYQWMVNGSVVSTTGSTYTPSAANEKVSCHVTLSSGGYTILDRTLYSGTVVFLDPEHGDNNNSGMDEQHPVKTWQNAYSKLTDGASWDENTIVLMSTSNKQATSDNEGFSITKGLQGEQLDTYAEWKSAVDASHLAKNVTITGKYNGKVYPAVIENYGFNGKKYLGIFGDTRFEYITFNHASGAGHSDYIFCQYNNLEMGEGIQMTNYDPTVTPGYGGIDGARIFSMQIYGGFNNDARFHKNNEILYNRDNPSGANNSLEAMERTMPHGKEGFSITLKSGRYSSVCVGGRQAGAKLNGLMGTPNMPLKCTITLDIDREWNDAHNQGINNTKADYDCGIILAGCQEGAMYADADIIVKSGYVARIVSGTEGNKIKNYQGNVAMPANTYAGRANILIDPRDGEGKIDNSKVVVTELYGGSTGRGYLGGNTLIDNPVYGYSTITINGGTFKILPENNPKKEYIFCGIFGAGAGGYNGIGDDNHHTPDEHIAYWGNDRILFGKYDIAKNNLVSIKCYNADEKTDTIIDPRFTKTKIVINDGVFGTAEKNDFDGVYAGGSGFMSPSLFWDKDVIPNVAGGNVYGRTGEIVSSLTINGGTFYCKNGIFAGGRGTDKFYSEDAYKGNPADYTELGQTYGNTELIIKGGTFNCDIFGGGYGVADAKLKTDGSTATLNEMARVYGKTTVTIGGSNTVINGSVYGGGDMAAVDNGTSDATDLTIKGNVVVNGDVFASGNGRTKTYTQHPEDVGFVRGNANLYITGTPTIYGDIYGGGAYGSNKGNTNVIAAGGYFYRNIYGGGQGDLATMTRATVDGNTSVTMSGVKASLGEKETNDFATGMHNVYGGGYQVATVTGSAGVNVTRTFVSPDIMDTEMWEEAYNDNSIRNFWVFGGGYGLNTVVGNTDVNINIDINEQNVILGSVGGSYAGVVDHNTSTTIQGTPILRNVYGGGYGHPNSNYPSTGVVKENSTVEIRGGKMYCNVFGGGKGDKTTASDDIYKDVARVKGNTSVTVTGTAAIYGNVYGGGDIANVGDGTPNYNIEPTSTSVSNGNIVPYTHNNSRTFVNVTGGNIYGMVFGGGLGRVRTTSGVGDNYIKIGRVTGNTLVHVANSLDADNNTVEPYIWNRIYGAGSYGVVDGNSMVHIEGGNLGYNIFGGGFGDAGTDKGTKNDGTYADVLGNTNVTIDGGSWIWYAMADVNGNITTWNKANTKLSTPYERMRNMTEAARMSRIQSYVDNRFFEQNDGGYRFVINHNIYGGGNAACYVGGTSKVVINHSPLTDVKYNGKTYNLLDPNTAAGCCWYTSIDNIRNPQFSVFGAGYGMNTQVKNTEVKAQPGSKLDAEGNAVGGNRYLNQPEDQIKYEAFEQAIYDNYQAVDDNARRMLYGMGENTDDPRTFLRYRASQLAWSIGAPAFTFMDIHGGGFSGYVTGNTKVVTDCQLTCRSVFGGGIGSKPTSSPSGNETYGQVGGNTDVKIYGGIISMNVFGGGAGIEPYAVGGTYKSFPNMALVNGKTNVDVYGEWYKIDGMDVERTLIFGSVYGGGDVANVGKTTAGAAELKGTETSYTTKVSIKGASIMSAVFAGGNGRNKSSHYDYTKLGAVYGNAGLFVNKADKVYPYTSDATPSADVIPYLWSRVYGGGNKGIINGNTLVKIDNGYFSDDIFAGGLGDVQANTANITSADVKGHTNLIVNGGEAKLTSLWDSETRAWAAATTANNHLYSPQYDPEKHKFKVNHNMYGGGNLACKVSGNSYITISKGMLNEQETVSATTPEGGFFATKEWKEVYYKTGSPYFCIFGGGYGNQTIISGNTNVNVNMVENGDVHLHDIPDRVEGEEYLHFIPGQSVMDIVGGGYEGKVIGETNVNIGGGTFARRIFGGGQYNSVLKSNVNITSIDCEDVFGGGMMGDVEKTVNVNIGTEGAATNEDIHIHGNVYGGNDVAGYVNLNATDATVFQDNGGEGVKVKIRGGHIYGNVYGAGNGDYLYALDKAGNTSPTVNEDYKSQRNTYPLVFTVPMRSTIASLASATDAQKIVNLNSWRPLTNKVTVDIAGKSANSKPDIRGNVYGGGNSATVVKTDANSHVTLNVGSYIELGGLFLGCDGEQLFTQTDTKDYIRAIKDIDGIDVNTTIDWTLAANKGIENIYLPYDRENDARPKAYPHILDLYFQPVAMSIRPQIKWCVDNNGVERPENLTNTTIGSFVCGGNRGNMDVVPDANGNAVSITFPEGLTITDKIVGGCYNANYVKNNTVKVDHVGGYLLGESRTESPMIDLTVKCKFSPSIVEKSGKRYYEGGNVYGGCYQSGVIVGDVKIDYRSNSLKDLDDALLTVSNENDIAACNIYGAGYGEDSYVYGDIDVLYSNQVPWRNNAGTTVNNVFGGGQKGNVIGNTDIRILNGKIHGSVTGGSYSGYLWGSAQVLVGYPKYYLCKKSSKYSILRADDASGNLALENTYYNANGEKYTNRTIKQSLYIMAGDIVSEQVFDAINAYDSKNGTLQTRDEFGEEFFEEKITKPGDYGLSWNGIDINIGVAVYGGGYSTAASGTSLSNTTVLRYTAEHNNIDMKYSGSKDGNINYANGIDIDDVETIKNYGGNTTMLIADDPSYNAEHITISPQTMKVATGLADNADLFQKYYMGTDNNYHFISVEGKYFKNGSVAAGTWPADISDRDHKFYEADTEGGIFGDGHLSYTEGFRNCELSGYGYASHSVSAGKILNTFQRLDMLRLKDNCIKLLGARDYATSSTDVTPYSISRVGEIQMVSSLDANQPLAVRKDRNDTNPEPDPFLFGYKKRNYLGLSNNIRYVGAIKTNDDFATAKWHGKDGQLGQDEYAGMSYQDVKTDYLKYHQYKAGISGNTNTDINEIKYQKRNEGTARNLIGIASGYALRIRNVRETYNAKGKLTEYAFYGPIVGVAEIRLVNVDPDEAGGYVYADDRHDGGTNYKRSLLKTGNFVFPYVENPDMFVVDDCFPNGWEQNKIDGKQNSSHYWYLTGYHYYLNANISAFTYNSAGNPIEFESNSEIDENDVEVLKGLIPIPAEKLSVVSWTLRSDHPTSFESDLEKRNYDDNAKDHSGYDLKDRYKLYISVSDKTKYSESEVHGELSMKYDAFIPKGTILPGTITSDISRLSFKLVDNADNTSSQYYKDHMEKPTKATLVLRAPAFRPDGNGGYVSDKSKMAMSVFYTNNGNDDYVPTASSVALSEGTAYYYRNVDTGEYEMFYDGHNFLNNVYTKTNDQYSDPLLIGNIKPTTNNVYYVEVERSYTYTVYLNIQYIQGPSPEGNITIANCALPGEYIKADASTITIDADQSMRPQSFYWRIGKLNAEGTAFADNSPWKKDDANDSSKGYQTWQVGTTRTGIFAECEAEGNNVLYIPAYYYMNGYGVQYGFASRESRENQEDEFVFYPIDIKRDEANGKILDRLDIHNFHLMDSHAPDVDLRLTEAVERAKNEPDAQPRIYIGDEADLKAFSAFVRTNSYHGANAQFVLLNNLTIPSDYQVPDEFAGTLHGDGYMITGTKLFKKNSGHIYNLGVVGGKIADSNTNTGRYHCCFESNGLKVYDIEGNPVSGYTADDFKYGKVAYDLNQYNMKKAANDDSYTYVEDYYRNGDFQYARIADETLDITSGITYLRVGNAVAGNQSIPYYGLKDYTAHNMEHTADIRSKGDHCEPLFEKNDINDYRFFGQDLQAEPELYPSTITSHKVSAALNRVWRTDGYYGNKQVDKFYYNAAIYNDTYKDTYVLDPRITAVNFNVNDDNASVFHGFGTAEDVTRNLLVYTKSNTSKANEAYDVVSKALSYTAATQNTVETPEAAIRGHHVIYSGNAWKASLLHLVDKQTFNAPIEFSVTGRSWYVRNPETETGYVEEVGTAWGSICLPFDVEKSTLSEGIHQYSPSTGADLGVKKNITFFYGTPAEGTAVKDNNNTLRHHYWFREFKSISGNKATFERPDASISNGGFAAYKPYIVSFPGSRYYEFDMTGQTITFEKTKNASIAVTDDAVAAATTGKPYHVEFTNEEASASKYAITIGETGDNQGMKFEKNQPIYAFRGYMTQGNVIGAKANSLTLDDDVIYISTDIRSIESLDEDENSSDVAGEYLRVYDAGNHSIGIESSYDTKLTVYTSAGQIARILDVRAGNSKYSGFASGIYIIGQKKLSVK